MIPCVQELCDIPAPPSEVLLQTQVSREIQLALGETEYVKYIHNPITQYVCVLLVMKN